MASESTPTFDIPKECIAGVVKNEGPDFYIEVENVPVPEIGPEDVLIKLNATGLCMSDVHFMMNDWALPKMSELGTKCAGHEGAGVIVKVGDRVGVKWLADSCLNCEQCRKGREQNCPDAKLSGFTVDGTFQQYVVSYVNHVTPIPEGFDSNAAASILCAGVTVYRAIKHSQTFPGDWIVLPGAGGGLGHLAIQYAKVAGLQVIAVDSGADKKKLCLELGADKWIDFQESKNLVEDIKAITGGLGAHSALVTAANSSGYKQAIEYLRGGGTLMAVGLPGNASLEASIFFTVYKSISILGSYVGNRQDAAEAIAIAARGEVKCMYAVKELNDLSSVYEGMTKGSVAGRIVLEMPK